MKIAIITPCYNSGALILETARTVREERAAILARRQDLEIAHVIIDDRSDDPETLSCLDEIAAAWPFCSIFKNQGPQGPAGARNFGINNTAADWYGFLDADDLFIEGGLAVLVERALAKSDTEWIAGEVTMLWPDGRMEKTPPSFDMAGSEEQRWNVISGAQLLARMAAPPHMFLGACMVRDRVFKRNGLFPEDLLCGEDWTFTLAIALNTCLDYTSQSILLLRRGHESLTSGSRTLNSRAFRPTVRALLDRRFASVRRNLRWTLITQIKNLGAKCLERRLPVKGRFYLMLAWLLGPSDVSVLRAAVRGTPDKLP